MRRLGNQLCPRFQTAVDILGKRWTALIVRVLQDGPRRFNEILATLEVVSDRMLSARLKELEQEGIVARTVLPPPAGRVEYRLTEKGLALGPVVHALGEWGEKWIAPQPSPRGARGRR
jgi:DNA-binding HxlR family transcriptional regulator